LTFPLFFAILVWLSNQQSLVRRQRLIVHSEATMATPFLSLLPLVAQAETDRDQKF
jgi:hypothetical protein